MVRRKNDFYPSADWMTLELLKRVNVRGKVLEPCVGAHDIASILEAHPGVSQVVTNDIDDRLADYHLDARERTLYDVEEPDWTVTNPPFNQALPILQQAVEHSKVGAAFLLRISFMEPTLGRGPWLAANPPDQIIFLPRYSFTQDGSTDSVTCAWHIWYKRWDRGTIAKPIDVVERFW